MSSPTPIVNDEFGLGQLQPSPPLRERVYETLEKLMVDGVLPSGMHLVEDDLAQRLGVSRNPVREALQRLSHEGFVERQPGRGAFVHSPSRQEIDDVFHVRTLLESDSARLAAGRITDAELDMLRAILTLGEAAVEQKNAVELLELNERFHDVIILAAGNAIMAKMMVSLRQRIRWYFSSVVVSRAPGSWSQHEEIYQSLRDHDAARAADLMGEHVGHTRQTIKAQQLVN